MFELVENIPQNAVIKVIVEVRKCCSSYDK